jgi:hypothetical protein
VHGFISTCNKPNKNKNTSTPQTLNQAQTKITSLCSRHKNQAVDNSTKTAFLFSFFFFTQNSCQIPNEVATFTLFSNTHSRVQKQYTTQKQKQKAKQPVFQVPTAGVVRLSTAYVQGKKTKENHKQDQELFEVKRKSEPSRGVGVWKDDKLQPTTHKHKLQYNR